MEQSTKACRKTRDSGFTIIEILVVVAILGILAAISIPTFTKYATNARRADGKVALMEAAQIMERFYTNNYTYNGTSIPTTSGEGYYNLTLVAPNATAFTITATPVPGGKMASDTLCATMRINHLGQRQALNSSNDDTTDDCWR